MTDLITIFCQIDDFCKEFEKQFQKKLLSVGTGKRERSMILTASEVMTISIWYHFSGFANFKDFYTKHVQIYLKNCFPKLPSYTRFIELRKMIIVPLLTFLSTKKLGTCTGVSFIDSFKIEACHTKRISSHKTLKNIARRGKTSVGWFYGLKVHLVFNHKGEILAFHITAGNVADNNQKVLFQLTKNLTGKLFGDKGYLVKQSIFEQLYRQGLQLITKVRSNMKSKPIEMIDKLLLQKRGIVESAGDILKNHLFMEHSRHRSAWGAILHIFTSLTAYQFRDKKPSISSDLSNKLLYA